MGYEVDKQLRQELNYAKVALTSKDSKIEYYKNLAHKLEKENFALEDKVNETEKLTVLRWVDQDTRHKEIVKELEGELNKIIIQAASQGNTILKLYKRIDGYEYYVKQQLDEKRKGQPLKLRNAELEIANSRLVDNLDRLKKIIRGLNEDAKKFYGKINEAERARRIAEDNLALSQNNLEGVRRDNKNFFKALERKEDKINTFIQANQEILESLYRANSRILNLGMELNRERKITKDHVALARMENSEELTGVTDNCMIGLIKANMELQGELEAANKHVEILSSKKLNAESDARRAKVLTTCASCYDTNYCHRNYISYSERAKCGMNNK